MQKNTPGGEVSEGEKLAKEKNLIRLVKNPEVLDVLPGGGGPLNIKKYKITPSIQYGKIANTVV